jgi:TIR domain
MGDIFISYAREDEAQIRHLAYVLEKQGWSVFWDRRIPAGQTWRSYIGHALSNAKCVIVAWSRNSISSKWVIEEADEGQQRGILVPVLLDSIQPPMGFRGVQAADLVDWQPDRPSPNLNQLIQDISVVLGTTVPMLIMEQHAGPKSETSGHTHHHSPRHGYSRRFAYIFVPMISALLSGIGYWGYQVWLANFPSALQQEKHQSVNADYRVGLVSLGVRLCCINPLDAERSLEGLLLCGHSVALRHA